jgi:hypothetical protein
VESNDLGDAGRLHSLATASGDNPTTIFSTLLLTFSPASSHLRPVGLESPSAFAARGQNLDSADAEPSWRRENMRSGAPIMAENYMPLLEQLLSRTQQEEIAGPGSYYLCILGTYPADFNMIEYGQRLVHYLPQLKARGVKKVLVAVNGSPDSAKLLAEIIGIPDEVELIADPSGEFGRTFGVKRGWLPDQDELSIGDLKVPISPYAKLFGMLLGLGARDTLPSVITGYLGNPSGSNKWIESALAQGQRSGRWPNSVLQLDETGSVTSNEFDNLPLVGSWGRRPLELATLRLQTMLGVSLERWSDLQPVDDRCLTQLGGLLVVDDNGRALYEWRDNGICNVADFEKVLESLDAIVK